MFFIIQAGRTKSPECITQRNGDVIIKALYQYQATISRFPPDLEDLEPTLFADNVAVDEQMETQSKVQDLQAANEERLMEASEMGL